LENHKAEELADLLAVEMAAARAAGWEFWKVGKLDTQLVVH
jgi:hypothetical protein